MTALLELHKQNQHNTDEAIKHTVEGALEAWASHSHGNRTLAQFIRSFFKANYLPITVVIDNHTQDTRAPPKDEQIRQIYNKSAQRSKTLISLQADTGERVGAVSLLTINDLPDFNQDSLTIYTARFRPETTKNNIAHTSYYTPATRKLLQAYIDSTDLKPDKPLFPWSRSTWCYLTRIAKKQGIHLVSHHLRKRFRRIAETSAVLQSDGNILKMPINDIEYLSGDSKTFGHSAGAYSLATDDEIKYEYEKLILPKIRLGSKPQPSTARNEADHNTQAQKPVAKLTPSDLPKSLPNEASTILLAILSELQQIRQSLTH